MGDLPGAVGRKSRCTVGLDGLHIPVMKGGGPADHQVDGIGAVVGLSITCNGKAQQGQQHCYCEFAFERSVIIHGFGVIRDE